ncbi:MAG: membrane associated serine protease [Ktedonobacterales bacterium]|nr:MAG: membrane associated serine protease [Ktedonobacterales bacterium]
MTNKKRIGIVASIVTAVVLLGIGSVTFYQLSSVRSAHAARAFTAHYLSKSHMPYIKLPNQKPASGSGLFSCQANNAPVRCYSPQQIRTAYDINRVLKKGIQGQGQTIVIIDAYQSPTITQDLSQFNHLFGLQNSTLNIIAPNGLTPFDPNDPNQVGWAGEITLDVEWSHAIAPLATIDLVLAPSNADTDLLSVTEYAVNHNLGDVISQSFGEAESCADPNLLAQEHQVFKQAVSQGMTVFASSGDDGAAQPTCDGSSAFLSASTPASDPLVTGVGATSLNASQSYGKYLGETAWNDQFGASGGGFSTLYKRPHYQTGSNLGSNWRGVPDVAYNGDVNGGVLTVWGSSGYGPGLVFIFGGTSAGSPQWAAMLTLVDQTFGRQGFINTTLYRGFAAAGGFFHDITSGNNTFDGVNGYNTRPGWDAVTGWGSFDLGNSFFGPAGSTLTVNRWGNAAAHSIASV